MDMRRSVPQGARVSYCYNPLVAMHGTGHGISHPYMGDAIRLKGPAAS